MPPFVESLAIPAVKLIHPPKHGDERGFFSETYSQRDLAAAGIDIHFVQDNHAFSAERGTVRGLAIPGTVRPGKAACSSG